MRWTIGIYLVDQSYGGPEEGGWWYEVGELQRLVSVERNEERAYERCRHLNRVINKTVNRDRRPTHSVLSEGVFSAQVHEGIAVSYPARRPHYE